MQKILAVLLLSIVLAACSMPETRIYSLKLTTGARSAAPVPNGTAAVIVTSPRHLSQPYIVYRASPYQFAVAHYAKWNEPPDKMVRDAFKDSLSLTLFKEVTAADYAPEGAYALMIDLKRFERSDADDGSFADIAFEVIFQAPDGSPLCRNSFAKKTQLTDRSFINLAKGLSSALGEGTEEVRGCIEKEMKR